MPCGLPRSTEQLQTRDLSDARLRAGVIVCDRASSDGSVARVQSMRATELVVGSYWNAAIGIVKYKVAKHISLLVPQPGNTGSVTLVVS